MGLLNNTIGANVKNLMMHGMGWKTNYENNVQLVICAHFVSNLSRLSLVPVVKKTGRILPGIDFSWLGRIQNLFVR